MPAFTPLYRRIMEDLRTRVDRGDLRPGDKLPSTRELAEQYDTGASTVRQAIALMLETGELRGHQGRGVYVADRS